MSALEIRLKHARDAKGTWHKAEVINVRIYMAATPRKELINAIEGIKEQSLLRVLWEAGLDEKLQQFVVEHSKRLAEKAGEEVI